MFWVKPCRQRFRRSVCARQAYTSFTCLPTSAERGCLRGCDAVPDPARWRVPSHKSTSCHLPLDSFHAGAFDLLKLHGQKSPVSHPANIVLHSVISIKWSVIVFSIHKISSFSAWFPVGFSMPTPCIWINVSYILIATTPLMLETRTLRSSSVYLFIGQVPKIAKSNQLVLHHSFGRLRFCYSSGEYSYSVGAFCASIRALRCHWVNFRLSA